MHPNFEPRPGRNRRGRASGLAARFALLALALLLTWGRAGAQNSTANVQGSVTDESGAVLAGADVTAVNRDSGFERKTTSQKDGAYNLTLTPGTWEIKATIADRQPQSRIVRVEIGSTVTESFQLSSAVSDVITVSGTAEPAREMRTSEVATNITQEQLKYLPQDNRNFLSFAQLAPGVTYNDGATAKSLQAGATSPRETNIYIDGASYKNNILEGGAAGQDSSRGNPFPQNAVEEFRVVTDNYKAEYELASSVIITAVTKSGGNTYHADAFGYYQNKSLVTEDPFAAASGSPKPDYTRYQEGASLGGPIIKDTLNFFASYEGNEQNRANTVILGNPAYLPQFGQYQGTFASPFRENLFFGKLSYAPGAQQTFDLSVNTRHETDIKDFGQAVAFQNADNVKNGVDTVLLKHLATSDRWLNEASIQLQRYNWNPVPTDPTQPALDYQGIILLGGHDTVQQFDQDRGALRDDFSLMGQWHGDHVAKFGVSAELLKYTADKNLYGNPHFYFDPNISLDFPYQANYGTGNPSIKQNDQEYGLYVQDDWRPIPRLTVNAGLRWDYETNAFDNNYVTPAAIRTALTGIVPSSYFTDGNQRSPYTNEYQPRLGASYDLLGDGKTVAFAGAGRYYDRDIFNYFLDERYRLQYAVRTFLFSADGSPRNGQATLPWDPAYLSAAGLNQLIAAGLAPNPQVFLINNNTKPPYSDHYSLGMRHDFGKTAISVTGARVLSYNGITYIWGNRNPDGTCCTTIPGYNNVLLSSDDKRAWYSALYVSIDRPYTSSNGWGYSVSYTLSTATQIGGDLFSLDYPTVDAYPHYPTSSDQRHTLKLTGIVGLPWDVRLSTFINLGSGLPYDIGDASLGYGPNQYVDRRGAGRPPKGSFIFPHAFAYRSVDVNLQKDFVLATYGRMAIIAQGFNVFDFKNYGCFNGGISPLSGPPNTSFGQPGCILDPGGRRLQFGLDYNF